MAISPKNIGKMPQNLLKKIFWKINFIKMIEIFICGTLSSIYILPVSRDLKNLAATPLGPPPSIDRMADEESVICNYWSRLEKKIYVSTM